MKIVKLYNTFISNPYMAAEMDDEKFYGVRLDLNEGRFILGMPIDKCGVTKSMLSPIPAGEMTAIYNAYLDKFNFPSRELRLASGMTQVQFAEYFGIPRRTVENWELRGGCPSYLAELMEYKLRNEGLIQQKNTPGE